MPDEFSARASSAAWVAVNRRNIATPSFLEGPELAREDGIYCVDIPNGRVFEVSADRWELLCEYDGWPNGLKKLPDGKLLVADCKNGLVEIDPVRSTVDVVLADWNTQRFLGLNDLQVTDNGLVWFTDQGQTGLHDPSGRVFKWDRSRDHLTCILQNLPSPNGLRVTADGSELYVACTRDNSVWRAPLTCSGAPTKVGRFAMFYGPIGPDGLHIDEAGRIWVCLPGGDAVWVLNRKGEVEKRITFPDGAFPTNLVLNERRNVAYFTCSGAQSVYIVREYD